MSPKLARIWLAVFVLVVFVSGLATGFLFARRSGPPRSRFRMERPHGPMASRYVTRLATELDLSEAQRAEIQRLFGEHRSRLQKFHAEVRAGFVSEQRALHEGIREILTDEQRARFEALRWSPRRRGPPGRR